MALLILNRGLKIKKAEFKHQIHGIVQFQSY